MALIGVLLMSSGFALMATAGSAGAAQGRDKNFICHPVSGLGETKSGYNVIDPSQGGQEASSHIIEGVPQHSAEGRVDVLLGDDLLCPGEEPEEPDVATASVNTVQPSCEDPNGSWTTSVSNATVDGPTSGDGVRNGSVTVDFDANEGAEFAGGLTTKSITVNFGDVVPPEGFEFDPETGLCTQTQGPEVCPPGTDRAGEPVGTEPCTEVVSPPGRTPTTSTKTPTKKSAVAAPAETTVPSVVHAGIGSTTSDLAATRSAQGLALALAGSLVMVAGGLGMVRQRGVRARIQV